MESGRRASWEDPAGFQSDAGGGAAERKRKMRVCLLFQVLSNFRKPHFSFHFGFKKTKLPPFRRFNLLELLGIRTYSCSFFLF